MIGETIINCGHHYFCNCPQVCSELGSDRRVVERSYWLLTGVTVHLQGSLHKDSIVLRTQHKSVMPKWQQPLCLVSVMANPQIGVRVHWKRVLTRRCVTDWRGDQKLRIVRFYKGNELVNETLTVKGLLEWKLGHLKGPQGWVLAEQLTIWPR